MSALRGKKYTMLSDINLARRKISNVSTIKDDNRPSTRDTEKQEAYGMSEC